MLIRVDNRTFSDWPRTLAVYTLKSIPPRAGTGIQHESIDTPGSPEPPVVFKTGIFFFFFFFFYIINLLCPDIRDSM